MSSQIAMATSTAIWAMAGNRERAGTGNPNSLTECLRLVRGRKNGQVHSPVREWNHGGLAWRRSGGAASGELVWPPLVQCRAVDADANSRKRPAAWMVAVLVDLCRVDFALLLNMEVERL